MPGKRASPVRGKAARKSPYGTSPGSRSHAWICSLVPTFWALVATVFLLWPGLGVNWFGAGGNPNDSLDALSFSHQRLQYELSQIVPLAVIIVVGIVFYFLGSKTRQEVVTEPIAPVDAPVVGD